MATTRPRLELWAGRLHLASERIIGTGLAAIGIWLLSPVLPLTYAVGIPVFAIAAAVELPFLVARLRR